MLVLIGFAVAISIAGQMQVAYGHGCQAQGGCCTVGGSCVEATAFSPVLTVFTMFGLAGTILIALLGGSAQRKKLGAVFNIFI